MKLLRHFCCGAAVIFFTATGVVAEPASSPNIGEWNSKTAVEARSDGRDALTLTLRNPTSDAIHMTIPAGLIVGGASSECRLVVLRAISAEVPAQGALELVLPAAALSSRVAAMPQRFTIKTEMEPRLAPLLAALADQPDAPRGTSQLAVLALLENLDFAGWRKFSGHAESPPTPVEITHAIDALGLLRAVAPEREFALASDPDLKARALRNPWSRAKAMAIYGLDLGDGAAPPDLRQLLHTQAGDNCPICRQRALLQKAGDIP